MDIPIGTSIAIFLRVQRLAVHERWVQKQYAGVVMMEVMAGGGD